MKEVKEVVHVPTRELAEEVLRVAKENGLYEFNTSIEHMIYDCGSNLHISFEDESYCDKEDYLKDEFKIITAQEFLNRYTDSELDQLRKENEELKSINDTLYKENLEHHNELTLLKEQLKAIEDQPKVGDVCLFWDDPNTYVLGFLSSIHTDSQYPFENNYCGYENCIKATPENIQAKINELKND